MEHTADRLYAYWQSHGEHDLASGRRREAIEKLSKALLLAEEYGDRDPRLARTLASLGMAQMDCRRYQAALDTLARALEVGTGAQIDPTSTLRVLGELAEASLRLGRLVDATEYAKGAAEIREILHGKASYQAAQGKLFWADILKARGLYLEAEPLYRRALMLLEAHTEPEVESILEGLTALHDIYDRLERWQDAVSVLERQVRLRRQHRRFGRRFGAASHALAAARGRC